MWTHSSSAKRFDAPVSISALATIIWSIEGRTGSSRNVEVQEGEDPTRRGDGGTASVFGWGGCLFNASMSSPKLSRTEK